MSDTKRDEFECGVCHEKFAEYLPTCPKCRRGRLYDVDAIGLLHEHRGVKAMRKKRRDG